jgi:leader peptidase (prepilin peptidase) / N-methyltransferase
MQTISTATAWRSLSLGQRRMVCLGYAGSLAIGAAFACESDSIGGGVAIVALGTFIGLAATVDLATARLPNQLVGAAGIATAVEVVVTPHPGALAGALVGASLVVVVIGCARFVGVAGFGGGDIKLALVVGASTGVPIPTFAGVALVVAATSCLLSGHLATRRAVAFGPCLWCGWLVAKSSTILTAATVPPRSVDLYHLSCVASAELMRRAFTLGGGI